MLIKCFIWECGEYNMTKNLWYTKPCWRKLYHSYIGRQPLRRILTTELLLCSMALYALVMATWMLFNQNWRFWSDSACNVWDLQNHSEIWLGYNPESSSTNCHLTMYIIQNVNKMQLDSSQMFQIKITTNTAVT